MNRFPRGSVPEIIVEGETGFIVEDTDRAVEAVGRIEQISRARCRREFEQRFTDRHNGRGIHPDLPAIAQPVIYSSRSLDLLRPAWAGLRRDARFVKMSMGFSRIRSAANQVIVSRWARLGYLKAGEIVETLH
jgi:hypothetical protein